MSDSKSRAVSSKPNASKANVVAAPTPKKNAGPKLESPKLEGPTLEIDSEVARLIRQHARAHMKTEVCGVLIGENTQGIIEVQASIEALNAAQAGTHVTFTQDAWEAIYKVKDEQYPEERIVGWYHSHPGFGVFLSEHDTFIHRNFFSSPDQVAWVYDPHTDEEGCFGWIDGDIHRIPTFSIMDNGGDGVERTPKSAGRTDSEFEDDEEYVQTKKGERSSAPPRWLRWAVTTLSYLSALAVGFLVSWLLFPRLVAIPVDPYTGEPLLRDYQKQIQPEHRQPSVLDGTPTGPQPAQPSTQPSTQPSKQPSSAAPTPAPSSTSPASHTPAPNPPPERKP